MITKFACLIVVLLFFKNLSAETLLDFFDNILPTKSETEDMSNLQKSPQITVADLLNEKLNELKSAGEYYKYSKQLSEGLYIVQYENDKIIVKILRSKQINSGNNGFSSKAISREDILDEFAFFIQNMNGFWSVEIKNLEEYLDVKQYRKDNFENGLQTFSLISNYNWKSKIIIDKEIMNGYGSNFSGQIFNRTQTRNHLRFNNQPCDIYSDLTACTIIPFDGGARAKVFTVDKLWNRIIWFDKDQFNSGALNPQFTLTSPLSYYSLAFPTDITHGTTVVTNNNLNSCGFTGKDTTINLIIAELANNRISKVNYRIRTYMSNCSFQQLNKEYNILDNTFTVIKSNCNFPYSLALHQGNDNNNINDDLIWYSEGSWNTKRLNCIYTNSGNDVPNHSITSIDFGRGPEPIYPGRISVYKSPDGLKNALCFVDEQRNSLIFLKLDQYGKIDFTPGNYFIGETKFGEEQKLQSVILTSNNNGLDGVTVWAVTNAPGGCVPICGSMHTLKINYIINTPINVEYLASYWKGTNSQNSFVNLNNLHVQNGYVDIFTMEKWDDNFGMRRFKPGIDIISNEISTYCYPADYCTYKIKITNPAKVKFSGQHKYANGPWEGCEIFVNNNVVPDPVLSLPSGTNELYISRASPTSNMTDPEQFKLITEYIPLDESSFENNSHKITIEKITLVTDCNNNGGCPFVFVDNGLGFVKDNNILHRSEFEENIGIDIQDKYLLKINPFQNQIDSTCQLKIKELNNDISHFDNFNLVAIDHPLGTNLGITENNDYVLYFPTITLSPENALHNEENVTSQLNYDSNFNKTISGDEDDDVNATFAQENFSLTEKMKNVLAVSLERLDHNLKKTNFKNRFINKNSGYDSRFTDSVAVLMDPSVSDRIFIGPPIKKPGGEIIAYDFHSMYQSPTTTFAKRQNTSPVLTTVGSNVNIDSVASKWISDFKISYMAVTPVYYGGYIENQFDFVEAIDSLNGDVLSSLQLVDQNYSDMDSTTNITLKFKNTFGEVSSGFVRHFVLITTGKYEKVTEDNYGPLGINPNLSLPQKYELYQNYPNPFNPATKISYDLPKDGLVNLVVYDILGREISRVINNELKTAGRYTFIINGSNLASGIYFYRIESNNFVQTKRMVLIK